MIAEYTVIACYLLILLGMGRVLRRYNKNPDDFFRCGCRSQWWLLGVSNFMAGSSAGIFVSASGLAYNSGGTVFILLLCGMLGPLVQALFLAARFRRLRAITGPEVVRSRYNAAFQQFYAWIGLFTGPLTAALHLWALAIFGAAIFSIPQYAIILVMGGVVIFYSANGGRWAVMGTDFLQAIVTLPISLLVAWLSIRAMGGPVEWIDRVGRAPWSVEWQWIKPGGTAEPYTWPWLIAVSMIGWIAACSLGNATRYFPAKDDREASKAAWLLILLQPVAFLIWTIPSLSARFLYPDLVAASGLPEPAEAAYAVTSLQLLPSGLVGLLVVALLASAMSTLDSGVNNVAAVFVKDVYPALCRALKRKPKGEADQLRYGRMYSVASGLFMIGIAMYFAGTSERGLFETALRYHAWVGLPLLLPLCLGLFIRRTPVWSGFACFSAAVASVLLMKLGPFQPDYPTQVLLTAASGVATFLLSGLFFHTSDPTYRWRVARFFGKMQKPVEFADEVGEGNDTGQFLMVGSFSAVIGAATLGLLFLSDDAESRWIVIALSGGILSLAGLLLWLGNHLKKV